MTVILVLTKAAALLMTPFSRLCEKTQSVSQPMPWKQRCFVGSLRPIVVLDSQFAACVSGFIGVVGRLVWCLCEFGTKLGVQ